MWKKKLKLTAYLRPSVSGPTKEQQQETIQEHCRAAGHTLSEVYHDTDQPGLGLEDAIESLHRVQGIICFDLGRLVGPQEDKYRHLKPFIERHFFQRNKFLISLSEGIDTSQSNGQHDLIKIINRGWDRMDGLS